MVNEENDKEEVAPNVTSLNTDYAPKALHEEVQGLLREVLEPSNGGSIAAQIERDLSASIPDPSLRDSINGFAEADIHRQSEVLRLVEEQGLQVKYILQAASLLRKATDERYLNMKGNFTDLDVYRVMRGHRIEALVEQPRNGGMSRSQSAFAREVIGDFNTGNTNLVGIDGSHKDTQGLGPAEIAKLRLDDPEHPALSFDAENLVDELIKKIGYDFDALSISGIVLDPPSYKNQGVMTLRLDDTGDQIEIEMCNIRLLNIVGADTEMLLDRASDEIYLGRPVRIWLNDKWEDGKIKTPDGPHGLVEVVCSDGSIATVGVRSFDLDRIESADSVVKKHPLEDYPNIRRNRCVRFPIEEQPYFAYGYINDINSAGKEYSIRDSYFHSSEHDFDNTDIVFVDQNSICEKDPLVKIGSKIRYFDFKAQKQRVYEVMGYDPEKDVIITKIVSLRPHSASICHSFRADTEGLEVFEDGDAELSKEFPVLKEWTTYLGGFRVKFTDKSGTERDGKLFECDTLPFYMEVIIKKDPKDIVPGSYESYYRFNVEPNAVLDIYRLSR